jgi:uncharacterized protein (DUF302 family)
MTPDSGNGIVTLSCLRSFEETIRKLEEILETKGVKLFAVIDHSGEAERAGLAMPPTKVLIFGNPKAGTPLMLASPDAAIDLPLKILIRQDTEGKVWLSYNAPAWLGARHHLPSELLQNIASIEPLARAATE